MSGCARWRCAPENEAMFERLDQPVRDGTIALRRIPNPGAPTLLFAHANGMCCSVYHAFLAAMAAGFEILAYDARGHGRTKLGLGPAADPSSAGFAADLAELVSALRHAGRITGRLVLGGHSLGGNSAIRAAGAWPGLADGLLLIDPATLPLDRDRQQEDGPWLGLQLGARAARRRRHFPDRPAMADNLRGRGVFAGWPEAALQAYVSDGAVDIGNGVELACPPEWEAAVFRAVVPGFFRLLAQIALPTVMVIGGASPLYAAPEHDALHSILGDRIVSLPGRDHFFPVTDAAWAADAALSLAGLHLGAAGARAAR